MSEVTFFIEPDDFDRFRELIGDYAEFPVSFDEFDKRANELFAKSQLLGRRPQKVIVYPDEFIAYCRDTGLPHDTTTLAAWASAKNAKNTQARS